MYSTAMSLRHGRWKCPLHNRPAAHALGSDSDGPVVKQIRLHANPTVLKCLADETGAHQQIMR
jgi:hypothetical protein